jgi:hypothetical protein
MAARRFPSATPRAGLLKPWLLGGWLLGPGMLVIQAQPISKPACPLVVPANQAVFQPKRIAPDQVPAKNARGCLSPDDAIYGADGCPSRLCGRDAGVIQLPSP